ncbi:cytochrome c oxidase assembly factor Coa1 family protein [Vulcanococcus limneticus]|uniref:cytochrome c oxidase assembly factor Coa1 family protein n=1 Tax=Vulcanococcus limneticus TaxID=2170428 RepID=UPI000B99C4B8|nr:cytochrome c oxidase assembly factor Coa1 family protein [Vulcanococcus limneticus]
MEPKPPPNWWGRNWKWVVPTGCLSAVAGVVGFIALIISFVFGLVKASTPYKQALARAQADPLVISRLGTPIRGGFIVSGNIHRSGSTGRASLAIPLEGSRGNGTLYVEARQAGGTWTYSTLTLQPDASGERINLLKPTL